ncbi:MAG: hypothetical protein NT099_01600 [Candidatus Saganbacteria bacterium]|nr:hypothetical protein [Candidatus Saganbacteria bacterium]
MAEEEKTNLEVLEESLINFWKKNESRKIIRGFHTEIVIEPRVFMHGELNPDIAALLAEKIVTRLLSEENPSAKVNISREVITVTDKKGNPIVEIRDPKIISSILKE